MVTESILSFLMTIFAPVVQKLPDIDLSMLSSNGADTFLDWVALAGYMLPWPTVFAIISIILALQIFRIIVAFFKSLWGVLPIA